MKHTNKLKNFFIAVLGFVPYHISSAIRNYFPCKLIGFRTNIPGNSVVIYRMLGKRESHEIKLNNLLEDRELIEKFHPTETLKLGVFAIGDILCTIPTNEKEQKYQEIRKKMIDSIHGK